MEIDGSVAAEVKEEMPKSIPKRTDAPSRKSSPSEQTLAEAVYDAIPERIIRGTLVPGTVLSAVRWAENLKNGKAARAAMERHISHWQRYLVSRFPDATAR